MHAGPWQPQRMADPVALDSFLGKWHARWPEWNVAAAFVPAAQREVGMAWLALLQEFTDATWGGNDAAPGLAKLAWWQEELQGWARGAHRHPLATTLQARPAPWTALAAALATLPASRERPRDTGEAIATMQAFAQIIAACEAVLFVQGHGAQDAAAGSDAPDAVALLGERLLQHPQQAVPMQLLARHGDMASAHAAERAWAAVLLERWPDMGGIAPRRIHSALLRARVRRFCASGTSAPLAAWRAPFVAWGAARSSP